MYFSTCMCQSQCGTFQLFNLPSLFQLYGEYTETLQMYTTNDMVYVFYE